MSTIIVVYSCRNQECDIYGAKGSSLKVLWNNDYKKQDNHSKML